MPTIVFNGSHLLIVITIVLVICAHRSGWLK